ncbi:MAG TPA: IPT/TIG domain-containing protein [Methanoregulaceae archaeon]|nr:IPT/TIG domain-containing protein [Methanoregulaceae archaeon]
MKVDELIKEGCAKLDEKTFNKQSNEAAENFFKDALVIDPKCRRALCGLGMAQALQKNFDSALKNCEKVLAENPGYADEPVEVVKKDREYVYALRVKCYCLINQGLTNQEKFHDAINALDRYIELEPEKSRGWINKGYALFSLGRYEESDQYFQKYLEVEPRDSPRRIDVLNYRGFAAYKGNNLEKADQFFEQAYAEDPISFGPQITKTLVQDKRFYLEQQKKLITTAEKYLKFLLKDIRRGLRIVQYMFVIQFIAGLSLLVYALILAANGRNDILTYITGASGGLIAILSLVFSAPGDLQKNRIDYSQWMIAYVNWINTLYAVSGAINRKSKDNKEVEWTEIQPLQDYLTKVTISTIAIVEQYCEFSKKSNLSIPVLTQTIQPVPTITRISPPSGSAAGGVTVTITGTGFSGATAVNFGSTAAATFSVNSDTTIIATSPAGTLGLVDVTVTTPDGTSAISNNDKFTQQ